MKASKAPTRGQTVSLSFNPEMFHENAALCAAHIFSGRAEVWLGKGEATLRPRSPLTPAGKDALAAEFLEEIASQELRRRIAAENHTIHEYVVTQALLSTIGKRHEVIGENGAAVRKAGGQPEELPSLSDDQEKELARLIQEAEREIRDRDPGRP